MHLHAVKPRRDRIARRLTVIGDNTLDIRPGERPRRWAVHHLPPALLIHHPDLGVRRQRRRGHGLPIRMKTSVRHPPHVPELRKNNAAGLVHGPGRQLPAGNLFGGMQAGRPGVPLSLGRDLRRFRDDQPRAGALAVIFRHQRGGDISRLQGARPGHGGHDDAVFQRQRTDAMTIKK